MRGYRVVVGRLRSIALVGLLVASTAVVITANAAPAQADNPKRAVNCQARINTYINGDHSSISNSTYQARLSWLRAQCDRNNIADSVAEDQGALAPQVFPPGEYDRNGTPLACMDLRDTNFARHDNNPAVNPLLDPNWPGGMAPLNVPGDFMVANINGKAHFMVRNVVWAIEDTNGQILNPMLLKQETWFNQLGNKTHASIWFTEAYQPTSVWVEIQDEADMAYGYSGSFLPGRVTLSRTWFAKSGCHDKRGPIVIPQTMINHAKSLGWLQGSATTPVSHYLTMKYTGSPSNPANWYVDDEAVANPTNVNWTLGHPWWISGTAGAPPPPPPPPTGDPQPPTVEILQPSAGNTISGIYRVDIDAADDATAEGSLTVEFSVDGGATWQPTIWNAAASVHRYWWDTREGPDGSYSIVARARDADGLFGETAPTSVTANNGNPGDPPPPPPPPPPPENAAPAVTITQPTDGAAVDGIYRIDIDATDDHDAEGSLTVELSTDGGATWNSTSWNASADVHRYWWDTRLRPDGDYTLVARATDGEDAIGTSPAVSVTANNGNPGDPPPPPPPPPPPEPPPPPPEPDAGSPEAEFVYPAEGLTVNKIQRIDVTATDNTDSGSSLVVEFSADDGATWTRMNWRSGDGIYRYWWDTRNHPDGSYGLLARVSDTDGNSTVSTPYAMGVNNGQAPPPPPPPEPDAGSPEAEFVYPAEGLTVNKIQRLDVVAGDDADPPSALVVEFTSDGGVTWVKMNWNATAGVHRFWWETRDHPDGTYELVARVIDRDGNVAESLAYTIHTRNGIV